MITGAFNDLCSTVPTIETLAIRTYAYPSGALLTNTTYGNGANVCLTPHPGYLDSNISNIDYEIDDRVVGRRGRSRGTGSANVAQPTSALVAPAALALGAFRTQAGRPIRDGRCR